MKLLSYLRRHKKNDNTPYVMGGMVEILALLILGVFGLSALDHYLLRTSSLASVISAVLVDLANGDRGVNNLGGLAINPVLTTAAQAKANDMAAKSYFAHVSPDGQNSWYWFRQAGYTFLYAGENLAVDFSDSIDVERAWMNSPTHRANILNGNFTEIGIATASGVYQGRPTTFVVQMFGTPARQTASALPIQSVTTPKNPTEIALATTVTPAPKPATTTKVAGVATPPKPAATTAAPTLVLGTEAGAITAPAANWWQHLLASPKTVLRYAYYAFAVIILGLLAYVTELEFHRRHTRHVVATALLFVLMLGLFIIADFVLFAQPVIGAL